MAGEQQRTALYEMHTRLGAKMVPFAGWDMPVQYSSIMDEHLAVRESCGVFDISHMGQVFISGPEAGKWLNAMFTNDVGKLEIGSGHYTLMLNGQGGVIDDLILYCSAENEYFAVINASCIDIDIAWLNQHLPTTGVTLNHASAEWAGLAVQGPNAPKIYTTVMGGAELPARNSISIQDDIIVCSTGYTGEAGFEFFCRNVAAEKWLQAFIDAGAQPCGLGCRDSLRLEMGYPLNGSDLSQERTPLAAGLGVFVALDGPEFIGQSVLREQKAAGLSERLVGLKYLEKGAPPRAHYPVEDMDGVCLGELTSGVFSPSLKAGIAMAYVPVDSSKIGTKLAINVRGRKFPAQVVKKPFYRKS